MSKRVTSYLNLFLVLLYLVFISSCSDPYYPDDYWSKPDEGTQNENPHDNKGSNNQNDSENNTTDYTDIGPVAPDGVLETVTWNLEWYGYHEEGPNDEELQTKNFLTILDTINADLYAFQEVSDNESLNRLVDNMKGYKGFVAEDMDWVQKTAFVYNSKVIDSLSSGLITQGQDSYDWAGRFPFYFKFNYHTKDTTYTIYAVVIHAKCCASWSSYNRRKEAAQDLYTYLTNHKPNANIIMLGDYNDDVDVSIFNSEISPYEPFTSDDQDYKVPTKIISKNHQGTTVRYRDAVDHITISDELFEEYIPQSAKVLNKTSNLVDGYGSTTSDHYPVIAEFDL